MTGGIRATWGPSKKPLQRPRVPRPSRGDSKRGCQAVCKRFRCQACTEAPGRHEVMRVRLQQVTSTTLTVHEDLGLGTLTCSWRTHPPTHSSIQVQKFLLLSSSLTLLHFPSKKPHVHTRWRKVQIHQWHHRGGGGESSYHTHADNLKARGAVFPPSPCPSCVNPKDPLCFLLDRIHFLKSGFRYAAQWSGKNKEFPCTPCPPPHLWTFHPGVGRELQLMSLR